MLFHFRGSAADKPDLVSFDTTLPNFNEDIRNPFKKWAADCLPGPSALIYMLSLMLTRWVAVKVPDYEPPQPTETSVKQRPATIVLLADGYPIVPTLDFDDLSPKHAKELLREYISAAWSKSLCFFVSSSMSS